MSGVRQPHTTGFTRMWAILKVRITEETRPGRNTSGKQYRIFVSGGNPPSQKINFGNSDNCINTFSLVASVDGYTVANSVDGNSQWNKSGSISFDVPDGSAFSVISNGMMAYGCDFGSFTLLRYQ